MAAAMGARSRGGSGSVWRVRPGSPGASTPPGDHIGGIGPIHDMSQTHGYTRLHGSAWTCSALEGTNHIGGQESGVWFAFGPLYLPRSHFAT